MKKIAMYKTKDNKLFASYTEALNYLKSEYAHKTNELSKMLAFRSQEQIQEYINSNLALFIELDELLQDMKETKP